MQIRKVNLMSDKDDQQEFITNSDNEVLSRRYRYLHQIPFRKYTITEEARLAKEQLKNLPLYQSLLIPPKNKTYYYHLTKNEYPRCFRTLSVPDGLLIIRISKGIEN